MKQLALIWQRWQQDRLFFVQIVVARALYHVAFLPLSFVLAPLLRRAKVRVLRLDNPQHIGHLALDPDCYVKEGIVGLRLPARRTFLVCRRDRIVNADLVRYWRRYFVPVTSPIAHDAWCALARRRGVGVDAAGYFSQLVGTVKYPEIYRRWTGRPPLLTVTDADEVRGRAALARLGMPADAWYVCVHCREAGVYDDVPDAHDFRNASIANFADAMAMIAAAGGWCVRMGDPSMSPLAPMAQVIDYAHDAERRPWLDLFLVARARFFLGTSSGLLGVAAAFGVPAGLTNQAPMSVVLPLAADDVGIPKLVWDERQGRVLTFAEVLGSPAAHFRFQQLYREAGLRVLENDAQDVAGLAAEMLARTAGDFEVTPQDELLQEQFKRLLAPGHYSYGAASRVGRDFLRCHRELLDPPGAGASPGRTSRAAGYSGG